MRRSSSRGTTPAHAAAPHLLRKSSRRAGLRGAFACWWTRMSTSHAALIHAERHRPRGRLCRRGDRPAAYRASRKTAPDGVISVAIAGSALTARSRRNALVPSDPTDPEANNLDGSAGSGSARGASPGRRSPPYSTAIPSWLPPRSAQSLSRRGAGWRQRRARLPNVIGRVMVE